MNVYLLLLTVALVITASCNKSIMDEMANDSDTAYQRQGYLYLDTCRVRQLYLKAAELSAVCEALKDKVDVQADCTQLGSFAQSLHFDVNCDSCSMEELITQLCRQQPVLSYRPFPFGISFFLTGLPITSPFADQ